MDLPMTTASERRALYYPFHLCQERTLRRMLEGYASVHFRDYMALQITAMSGTTAYMDRMGDQYGELVKAGRIVQGYPVSGPLDEDAVAAVNRDLADSIWRDLFHKALKDDRRFQRGLFDFSHRMVIGGTPVPGPAVLLRLAAESRAHHPVTIQDLAQLSRISLSLEEGYDYEYALALVKTSASLVHTIRLSVKHGLEAVTDSERHFRLFERTLAREQLSLPNRWIIREDF